MLLLLIPNSVAFCGERSIYFGKPCSFGSWTWWSSDCMTCGMKWRLVLMPTFSLYWGVCISAPDLRYNTWCTYVLSSVYSRISVKFHFIAQSKINNVKIFPGRLRSVLWQSLRCRLNDGSPLLMSSFSALCQQWGWFHLNWRLHLAPCISLVCFNFISCLDRIPTEVSHAVFLQWK